MENHTARLRTRSSDPLRVDSLPWPGGAGRLGLTLSPGKSRPDALFATRPGHIRAEAVAAEAVVRPVPGAASPNGNSVSLETEMVKAVDVKQQHDMALSIYRSVSEIIRASLGRR